MWNLCQGRTIFIDYVAVSAYSARGVLVYACEKFDNMPTRDVAILKIMQWSRFYVMESVLFFYLWRLA